jgi:CO/xanthine dehydrogenase FAD-binding subunit
VRLVGTAELCGGALDARVFAGLDALVRDQIMAMKTTFTPGHYRRRVAGVLARRLVKRLYGEDEPDRATPGGRAETGGPTAPDVPGTQD